MLFWRAVASETAFPSHRALEELDRQRRRLRKIDGMEHLPVVVVVAY